MNPNDITRFYYRVSDYPRLIQHRRFIHKLEMEGYSADVEVTYDLARDKILKEQYTLRKREEKVDEEGNNYVVLTKLGEYTDVTELIGTCKLLVEDYDDQ